VAVSVHERNPLRPAVFLDRDGVIADEVGYLNHISRFRMFPFAAEAIRQLNESAWAVVVVTNQSGVGRSYFPESLVREVHEAMTKELSAAGAKLDGIYYCPHVSADNCSCRKPKTGMLDSAATEHHLDLKRSFVVGDKYADIELARNAGAQGILVRTGYGAGEIACHSKNWAIQPVRIADDLLAAAQWILRQSR
jgi:D-glycero-D-manno-heptose 1,7-bisphosphate phosphatase